MSVAFFDLDNTLVKGSSLYYLAKYLVKSGLLLKKDLAKFAAAQAKFIRSKTEDPNVVNQIRVKALELVKGKKQSEIIELCENSITDNLFESLYTEVLQYLKWHQDRNHMTWIVTASPIEIASSIARKLGMTGALGTISEVKNNRYTGKLLSEILHGKNKADAVIALSKSLNINLDNAYAYSDSLNDLPLLCSVGTATVVNPNKEFKRIANKNKWREIDTSIEAKAV